MSRTKDLEKLSASDDRIIGEYMVNGHNQVQAVIFGLPKVAGWKRDSQDVEASRFFARQVVKDRIAELAAIAKKAGEVSVKKTLTETARIAYFDTLALYDENGALKNIRDWPEGASSAIKTLTHDKDGNVKTIQFWDKNAALEKLFKYEGLYEKDNLQKSPTAVLFEEMNPSIQKLLLDKLREFTSSRSELDGSARSERSSPSTH